MAISISVAGAQGEGGAPILPCAFYGNVTIDGKPAPVGTEITAKIDDRTCGNITVAEVGKYGGPGGFDPKLVVVGSAADENKIISFYVDGDKAEETALWTSGGVNRLDLSVKKTRLGVSPGAGEGAMPIVVVMGIVVAVVVAVTLILVGLRMRKR